MRTRSPRQLVDLVRHAGALAAEQQDVVWREGGTRCSGCSPCVVSSTSRPGSRVARGKRSQEAWRAPCEHADVIHGGAADPPVVEREAAGLDDVQRHAEAGGQADEQAPEFCGMSGWYRARRIRIIARTPARARLANAALRGIVCHRPCNSRRLYAALGARSRLLQTGSEALATQSVRRFCRPDSYEDEWNEAMAVIQAIPAGAHGGDDPPRFPHPRDRPPSAPSASAAPGLAASSTR